MTSVFSFNGKRGRIDSAAVSSHTVSSNNSDDHQNRICQYGHETGNTHLRKYDRYYNISSKFEQKPEIFNYIRRALKKCRHSPSDCGNAGQPKLAIWALIGHIAT